MAETCSFYWSIRYT